MPYERYQAFYVYQVAFTRLAQHDWFLLGCAIMILHVIFGLMTF